MQRFPTPNTTGRLWHKHCDALVIAFVMFVVCGVLCCFNCFVFVVVVCVVVVLLWLLFG